MKFFNNPRRLKTAKSNIFDDKYDGKIQFNVIIESNIRDNIQKTAKLLRANQSQLTEHLLEVGIHHVNATIKDPEKRKLLEKHMETSHILNEDDQDEDVVIRMTENNRNWILLYNAKQAVKRISMIIQMMKDAGISSNVSVFNKLERDLNKEILVFADWLIKLKGDEEPR